MHHKLGLRLRQGVEAMLQLCSLLCNLHTRLSKEDQVAIASSLGVIAAVKRWLIHLRQCRPPATVT